MCGVDSWLLARLRVHLIFVKCVYSTDLPKSFWGPKQNFAPIYIHKTGPAHYNHTCFQIKNISATITHSILSNITTFVFKIILA